MQWGKNPKGTYKAQTLLPHQRERKKICLYSCFLKEWMRKHHPRLIKVLPVTMTALPLRALRSSGDFGHLCVQASVSPFTSQGSQTCTEPDWQRKPIALVPALWMTSSLWRRRYSALSSPPPSPRRRTRLPASFWVGGAEPSHSASANWV